jgi:anti-sigma B factor antagonist
MALDARADLRGWIELAENGAALVIRIVGELDAASRRSIEPALLRAIPSGASVIIDLADLTFCDSSGVAMFIAAHEKAEAKNTALSFRHPQGPVRRVFEITGLDQKLDLTG